MVQELLPILPDVLTTSHEFAALAALVVGLFLWLMGAAWGRALMTLLAVALGATIGMLVPRWQLWPVNSMATAVLGAVCFGVSAFLVERAWSGLVLGVVLVAWATLAVWMQFGGDQPFPTPPAPPTEWEAASMTPPTPRTPPQRARDLFERLPDTVRRVLPFAAATAMISAMSIALLWPRLAKASAFSTLGVTMLFVAAMTMVASRRPEWLSLVPEQASIQAAVLAVLVLLGVVVQWQLLPATPDTAGQENDKAGG